MLNPFPELLSLSFFAPLILRVVVGFLFLQFGTLHLSDKRKGLEKALHKSGIVPARFFANLFGLIELAGGIMLIIGFLTQIAALVLAILTVATLLLKQKYPKHFTGQQSLYLVVTAVLLSLITLGAGAFAIDLPL